jgi:hypothetical protein
MTIMKLAQAGVSVAMLGFVLSSMLGMGLGQSRSNRRRSHPGLSSCRSWPISSLMPLAASSWPDAASTSPRRRSAALGSRGRRSFQNWRRRQRESGLAVGLMVLMVIRSPTCLVRPSRWGTRQPRENRPLAVPADALPLAGALW